MPQIKRLKEYARLFKVGTVVTRKRLVYILEVHETNVSMVMNQLDEWEAVTVYSGEKFRGVRGWIKICQR